LRINVNPGSAWHSFSPDAFLILNAMRSASMIDEVYFSELRRSLGLPEHNFSFGQDRSAPARSPYHGQKSATEMVIGPWYLDEFGNPTREIKARD
jgi:hypothetical protein